MSQWRRWNARLRELSELRQQDDFEFPDRRIKPLETEAAAMEMQKCLHNPVWKLKGAAMDTVNREIQITSLRLDDRLSLRYQKSGQGPPLLLMHTIRTQLEYFREVVPHLTTNFTVYALDLPGHGQSSIDLSARYDEPYFRQAIKRFIEELDLEGVTLVGESIGGVLALTVASEMPQRIQAVFASNAYDYDTRYGDGLRRGNFIANIVIGSFGIPGIGAISAALENPLILGPILRGGLQDKSSLSRDLLLEFDRSGRRRGFRQVERRVFSEWRSWGVARAQYGLVRAPITLIYGDHDWSYVADRQRNARDVAGSRVITLEDTGHFASLERPQDIARIILDARRD